MISGRRRRLGRPALIAIAATAVIAISAGAALAQGFSIQFDDNTTLTERAVQLVALLTVLSLAPSILIMVTSFTRIIVVLSAAALGHRSPDSAAQLRDDQPRAVSHRLHHGADIPDRLRHRCRATGGRRDRFRAGFRAELCALPRLHAQQCARKRSRPVHGNGKRGATGHAGRVVAAHSGARLHDRRAAQGL